MGKMIIEINIEDLKNLFLIGSNFSIKGFLTSQFWANLLEG
jgi:hypothetical protein